MPEFPSRKYHFGCELQKENSWRFQSYPTCLKISRRSPCPQRDRNLRFASQCCERIGLAARAKAFALDAMKKIVLAEATIHGQLFSSVHLHEASSIDTFADLIGCAVALED